MSSSLSLALSLVAPRGGGFDPRTIAGLVGWYDLSDASTLTLSGSNITNIASKATSGIGAMVQATTANQGTNTGTIGGRAAMAMTGGAQHYVGAASATIGTTFVVGTVQPDPAIGTFPGLLSNGNASDSRNIRLETGITSANIPWRATDDYMATATSRLNGSDGISLKAVPRGGFYLTAQPAATFTMTPAISQAQTGLNRGWNGNIGEILFYDSLLNSAQIGLVEAYLRSKWGFNAQAVYFNGTTDMLRLNTNLGITNNQRVTWVYDFIGGVSNTGFRRVLGIRNQTAGVEILRDYTTTGQTARYYGDLINSAGTIQTDANTNSGTGNIARGIRTTILKSFDLSNATNRNRVYRSNTDAVQSAIFNSGSTYGVTGGAAYTTEIGADGGAGSPYSMYLRAIWMDDRYIDFSSSTERDKFLNADGTMKDLGNGAIDGIQPKLYMQGHGIGSGTNLGTGGNFAIVGAPQTAFLIG